MKFIFLIGEQVLAVTVFFLLSVAYYAFFAPFLGRDIFEYVAFGVYSVLVSSILVSFSLSLYPCILRKNNYAKMGLGLPSLSYT